MLPVACALRTERMTINILSGKWCKHKKNIHTYLLKHTHKHTHIPFIIALLSTIVCILCQILMKSCSFFVPLLDNTKVIVR